MLASISREPVSHPRILGIGVANPPVRLTQEQSFHAAGYQGERIRKSFLNSDIMNGGRERTKAEFCALLDAADYKLTRIIPTMAPQSVIEAMAK